MNGNAFIVMNTGVELPAFVRKTDYALPSRKLLENGAVKSAVGKLKCVVHASGGVQKVRGQNAMVLPRLARPA